MIFNRKRWAFLLSDHWNWLPDRPWSRKPLFRFVIYPMIASVVISFALIVILDRTTTYFDGHFILTTGDVLRLPDGSLIATRRGQAPPGRAALEARFTILTSYRTSGARSIAAPISKYFGTTTVEIRVVDAATHPIGTYTSLPPDSPIYRAIDSHIREARTPLAYAAWAGTLPSVDRSNWLISFIQTVVRVYIWLIILIAASIGLFEARRANRAATGRCTNCGYDLRGNANDDAPCPECGWGRGGPGKQASS